MLYEDMMRVSNSRFNVDLMLATICREAALCGYDIPQSVLEAMRAVPRHAFVPEALIEDAYLNHPLPIGQGQTISQPFVVAAMTAALKLSPQDVVLEVGTGSGYQAAVLAQLAKQVFSVETLQPLAHKAAKRLTNLGYHNITIKVGNGCLGWRQHAPFDAIIVTACAREIPRALLDQLRVGGRLIAPIGAGKTNQVLTLLLKHDVESFECHHLFNVTFVPLIPLEKSS